jgi:lipoprotein-releasing system ATP-binding protein
MSESPPRESQGPGGLQIAGVTKTFRQASRELHVLRGIDFAVAPGEMTALVGPSGSGKSTLLHIAGLLERPDSGEITIAGQAVGRLGDDARSRLRSRALGFVYQYHHLLPEFSALENVVVPQMIAGRSRSEAKQRSRALLEAVGLAERLDHRPARLSGGEQQRVAIARALANQPSVLLADEPTGNLDPETAGRVFAVLRELVRQTRVAALIATHNLELARSMDRVLRLEQGRVVL